MNEYKKILSRIAWISKIREKSIKTDFGGHYPVYVISSYDIKWNKLPNITVPCSVISDELIEVIQKIDIPSNL